jgi:hypothetical protein
LEYRFSIAMTPMALNDSPNLSAYECFDAFQFRLDAYVTFDEYRCGLINVESQLGMMIRTGADC